MANINKYTGLNPTYAKSTHKIQIQNEVTGEYQQENMVDIIVEHKSTTAQAEAGTDDTTIITPLKLKEGVNNALALDITKQNVTNTATASIVAGNFTTTQKIRVNDQTINSDINVDDLFALPPAKNAQGKIVLARSLLAVTAVQPTPTPTGNTTNLNSVFKDINGDTWIVDGTGIATKTNTNFIETQTTLNSLVLDPITNILSISYTGENGTVQTKTANLSALAVDVQVSSVTYNSTTKAIVITESNGDVNSVPLTDLFNPNQTADGVTILGDGNATPFSAVQPTITDNVNGTTTITAGTQNQTTIRPINELAQASLAPTYKDVVYDPTAGTGGHKAVDVFSVQSSTATTPFVMTQSQAKIITTSILSVATLPSLTTFPTGNFIGQQLIFSNNSGAIANISQTNTELAPTGQPFILENGETFTGIWDGFKWVRSSNTAKGNWVVVSTAGTTALNNNIDGVLVTSGATTHTVALPTPVGRQGKEFHIQIAGANEVSIVSVTTPAGVITGHGHTANATFLLKHGAIRSITVKSSGTNWEIINDVEEKFFWTTKYLATDSGEAIGTFNLGNAPLGAVTATTSVYRVQDGNYTPTLTLNANPTVTSFSAYIDNSAGFATTILPANTDLPYPIVIPSGQGFSVHFGWSDGLWRWRPTPAKQKSTISGNIIAIANNQVAGTDLIFDNFKISMGGPSDLRLGMVTGTANVKAIVTQDFPGGSNTVNSLNTSTAFALSTTYVVIGDAIAVAGEMQTAVLRNEATGQMYSATVWRHNAIGGNWSGWVEKIGITTNQILTAGAGIAINSGVISSTTAVTKAHVRANSATCTFTGGSGAVVTWGVELQDTTNSFTPATGLFTAPTTGYYHIAFQVFVASTTGVAGARTGVISSVNGATFGSNNPIHSHSLVLANQAQFGIRGAETKFLTAGQTWSLRGFLDTTTTTTLSANANFDYLTIDEITG